MPHKRKCPDCNTPVVFSKKECPKCGAKIKTMRIITVNLPQGIIDRMAELINKHGFYPSRSELIRVAVREFLLKELENLEKYQKYALSGDPRRPSMSGNIDMRTIRFVRNLSQE